MVRRTFSWCEATIKIARHPPRYVIANTISRVLYSAEAEPLSFIYDCGHPQPLATYPPTLDEQPLIVGIHGLATRKAYCQRTLLPLRWALTPPFHPYQELNGGVMRNLNLAYETHLTPGGYFLLRYYTLADIEPLTRTVLCVARTFLSPCGQR